MGGEGDDREWDGWMASLTRWKWVWVSYGSSWWTGKPGVLQSMGSQRVGRDWAAELNCCHKHPSEASRWALELWHTWWTITHAHTATTLRGRGKEAPIHPPDLYEQTKGEMLFYRWLDRFTEWLPPLSLSLSWPSLPSWTMTHGFWELTAQIEFASLWNLCYRDLN